MILDDFMVRAAIAGIGVALAAAPLGCFVVWRKMAYFGDATAHAAILGVAISLALSTSIFAGVLVISILMAPDGLDTQQTGLCNGHSSGCHGAFGTGARTCCRVLRQWHPHRFDGLFVRRHSRRHAVRSRRHLGQRASCSASDRMALVCLADLNAQSGSGPCRAASTRGASSLF